MWSRNHFHSSEPFTSHVSLQKILLCTMNFSWFRSQSYVAVFSFGFSLCVDLTSVLHTPTGCVATSYLHL